MTTKTTKRNSNDDPNSLALPKRAPGRPSFEAQAKHDVALGRWCAGIIRMSEERAEQPDAFDVSSRGWCYLMESHGLFKGDFDTAQALINDCRKRGLLPLDICCEDESRSADNLEDIDDPDPKVKAAEVVEYVNEAEGYYHSHSFWDAQGYYIEMKVEKIDLKGLFGPTCAEFCIPITNAKGWVDINARARMMRRFKYWEKRGKQCVLLDCVDLDPGGDRIADFIRSNFADLTKAVGWSPHNLIIDRFGIDAAFANGTA